MHFLRGWYCKNCWQQSTTHPSTHPSLKRICCIPAKILNRWQANGVPRDIRSQHFKRLQQCLIDRCLCQKETSKKKHDKIIPNHCQLWPIFRVLGGHGAHDPNNLKNENQKICSYQFLRIFLAKAPGGAFFVFFVELEVGKVGQAFIPWISGFSQWIRIHWEDSLMWIVDVLWCMFCSLAAYPYIYILLHFFVNLSFYL